MEKILGIIGLRSGSKGLKNKNIKTFNGKPLFYWIVKKALNSKYLNRVIVSTDSNNYRKKALLFGVESPYLRSKKISKDSSDEIEFIKNLLDKLYKDENYRPDIIVRLLATVPFQLTSDIDKTILKLKNNKKLDSVLAIAEAAQHPNKALKIKKNFIFPYNGKNPINIGHKQNRKYYEKAYFRANIVATRVKIFEKYRSLTGKKNSYVLIPKLRAVDIDDRIDFNYATFIQKKYKIN